MDVVLCLALLGLLAGAIHHLAGLGGGLLLLLALSVVWEPALALSVTAPALLGGNLHRLTMFPGALDFRRWRLFAPGRAAGLADRRALCRRRAGTDGTTIDGGAHRRGGAAESAAAPRHAAAGRPGPGGVLVGGLTGAAGGAGLLVAPLLLSSGLAGEAFVATTSGCAVVMHFGRIAGYGLAGLFSSETALWALVVGVAIVLGNLLGRRLRPLLERVPAGVVEHGVLLTCVALSLLGFV